MNLIDQNMLTREWLSGPFQHRKLHLINSVVKYVSTSASVFSAPIDQFDEATDHLYSTPRAAPRLLNEALGPSHAFDEGDSQAVKWVGDQRASVLAQTKGDDAFLYESTPQPLQELVSSDSVLIQAADIAAGIARELWRKNTLVYLVRQFEYVTYNGERLSDDKAALYEDLLIKATPSTN